MSALATVAAMAEDASDRVGRLAAMLEIISENLGGGYGHGLASDAVAGCAAFARTISRDLDGIEGVAGEDAE